MPGVKGMTRVPATALGRECLWCREWKVASLFKVYKGNLRSYCRDCGNEAQRERNARDPLRNRRIQAAFRRRHPGYGSFHTTKWRLKNLEHCQKYQREWNQKNKGKRRIYDHRKRMKRWLASCGDSVTEAQINARVAMFGGKC